MHGGEDAGADEEGADEAEGEGADGEQRRPGAQAAAFFADDEAVDEGGADEPRHERGVFDGVPEPPATPAEFVVGPVAAECDTEGEGAPGGECPRAGAAQGEGIEAALPEVGEDDGVGDGKADVAGVEQRRMEDEAGVLEQGVEVGAVERGGQDAGEGVGGEADEAGEADADVAEDGEGFAAHGVWQVAAAHGKGCRPPGEDGNPE